MAVIAVLIDSRPGYLCRSERAMSLLQLPLGTGTILGHLTSQLATVEAEPFVVMPTFSSSPDYERAIRGTTAGPALVVPQDRLSEWLRDYEPSDSVLVMDARHWPAANFNLPAMLYNSADDHWAHHAVAVAGGYEDVRERIVCDPSGRVRHIRRYYNGITWPQGSEILCSLVSLSAMDDICFSTLGELRHALSARGIVSRDISVPSGNIDLSDEAQLLTLNERMVFQNPSGHVAQGYMKNPDGLFVGQECKIDPSARIIPPVIIQHGVTIEEHATVIGPAVLGSGSTVCSGSVVAQSVVASKGRVEEGIAVRHRVVLNGARSPASGATERTNNRPSMFQPWSTHNTTAFSNAFTVADARDRRLIYHSIKLIVDVVIASLCLIVLAPLLIGVAILLKLDSRGPVFFADKREGKDGRVFGCLKFRTMCEDAHQKQRDLYEQNEIDGPQFQLHDDPRITRVGRWLRMTNIDELPQLINVARGQMSLIGPRPSPFRENQICVPWRRARLLVRPGITGLWQICRHDRKESDFHQWIEYDILYARHRSLWLDAKIFLVTLVTFGARWSTPLAWLIPPHALHDEQQHLAAR